MNSRQVKLFLLSAVFCVCSGASAIPAFWEDFKRTYDISEGSALAKADCLTCHVERGNPNHNPYGIDVKQALSESGEKQLTTMILMGLHEIDSDADGYPNGQEIEHGSIPGDGQSAPPTTVEPLPSKPSPNAGQDTEGAIPFPKHAFHPTVVHFPIALFIFGALLDAAGAYRRSPVARKAGYWNMVAGLLATLLTIPTGFLAAYLEQFPISVGTAVWQHLIVSLAATVLMLTAVLWRRKGEPTGAGYWIVLIAGAVLVGATGHFGGVLVYGG